MSDVSAVETALTSSYTTDTTPINIGLNTGIAVGDSFYITDGTNEEYCTALAINGGQITVPVSGTNGFVGISNSYSTVDGAYVQILRRQDPDGTPVSFCKDIDELTRYMAKSIINQIDFSG